MATLWRRYFSRSDAASEAVEKAIEEQSAFEAQHPTPFDDRQRLEALRFRAARHFGAKLPAEAETKINDVVTDWDRAMKAAKETP